MKTLITPVQALKAAFDGDACLPADRLTEADIAAVEERHIVPVIGRRLHEKMLAGGYPELVAEYLAAPVALLVRLALQPRLDIRTGRTGSTAPKSGYGQPADDRARRRAMSSLRAEARALLHRATSHLERHRDRYPEYDPANDIQKRCTTDGGFVQIR